MKYGFPAKVEKDWYGESPYPVGPRGSICHSFCPALSRKSTNSYASFEKDPIPYSEGRLDTGIKIPLLLISAPICTPLCPLLRTNPNQSNFQISLLYSLMVLSEEKKPALAILTSIIFFHFSLSL